MNKQTIVSQLHLKDFRNFETISMEFGAGVHVFYGANAQGKTNFLEGIYYCATGQSARALHTKDLVRFGCEEAHLRAVLTEVNEANPTEMHPVTSKIDVHLTKNRPRAVAVNGFPLRKIGALFGVLLAVYFSPEDLALVKEGPAARRRFLDMELCQLSAVYCHELQQYYHILKQRNHLLRQLKHSKAHPSLLDVWDSQLVQSGTAILHHRHRFLETMQHHAQATHTRLTNATETLSVRYRPNTQPEQYAHKLEQSREKDIITTTTNVGIHKDDIGFYINGVDARSFGSQGQQRTAALSAKLAEISIMKEQTGRTPILLLDDVLSELDKNRQQQLLESVTGLQVFITCTGVESTLQTILSAPIPTEHQGKTNEAFFQLYQVQHGKITLERV